MSTPEALAPFWADGICINQAGNSEKVHQVQLMSTIFRSALSVFAYVGEEMHNSNLALDAILHLSEIYPRAIGTSLFAHLRSYPAQDVSNALNHFFERAWFRRLWIVQEALLANDLRLICGIRYVNWYHFRRALLQLKRLWHLSSDLCSPSSALSPEALVLDREHYQAHGPRYLLELLETYKHTEATLARDHILH
jgi:hypothetical protein